MSQVYPVASHRPMCLAGTPGSWSPECDPSHWTDSGASWELSSTLLPAPDGPLLWHGAILSPL